MSKLIKMPKIPESFLSHPRISLVLHHIITEFYHEEQTAIFLYCIEKLPLYKIAVLADMTESHVASTLTVYFSRLSLKLDIFQKAMPYSTGKLLHISALFPVTLKEVY